MNRDEAKKILQILATADGGCIFCVRSLFIQFARTFPEFAGVAQSVFKEKFEENLLDESDKQEIVRDTIKTVLKNYHISPLKIILFGSRARGDFDKDSDWDVLIVIKEKLARKEKEKIAETIRKTIAKFLIPCDVIIRNESELSFYDKFYGTVTYEALKEGVSL
jgi:predicted nucleotidyltransferase